MKLKFGVRLPNTGPLANAENISKVADQADALGFNAVSFHDHICLSREEGYHNSGGLAEVVDEREKKGLSITDVYEGMVTLAAVAGHTKHVRLIPSAFVLTWRHPVLFGKQIATLHDLSNHRAVCCVSIGNLAADFRAMGVSTKLRGRLMDEYLEVLSTLLQKGEVTFKGRYIQIDQANISPKPRNLPIWIAGGFNDITYRRVADYAQGFFPSAPVADYQKNLPKLDDYLKSKGRSIKEIEVGGQTFLCIDHDAKEALRRCSYTIESFFSAGTLMKQTKETRAARAQQTVESSFIGSPDQIIEKAAAYADAGVGLIDMRLINRTLDDVLQMMELFAAEVMPSFG